MTGETRDISPREAIRTHANPKRDIDYIVTLEGFVRPRGVAAPLNLTLCYIPDRLIVAGGDWRRYLKVLSAESVASLEELAARILSDANNEVVPRWLSVSIRGDAPGQSHKVVIEDRQPKWDNPHLLRRIPSV